MDFDYEGTQRVLEEHHSDHEDEETVVGLENYHDEKMDVVMAYHYIEQTSDVMEGKIEKPGIEQKGDVMEKTHSEQEGD